MECLNCHRAGAKFQGQNTKSKAPYIATAYYYCPHCHTRFSIDKTEGEIITPTDPDTILRRVLTDIASLPKENLKIVSASVTELL
jgi:hypothetical protein